MKTSTFALLTAFISAAFGSLVGARDPEAPAQQEQPAEKPNPGTRKSEAPLSQSDFIRAAAREILSDVLCARIAMDKAHSQKVRELAAAIAKDHSVAHEELKALAEKLKVTLSGHPDEELKRRQAALEARSGSEFDTAFLNHMAVSHRKNIALFEAGARVSNLEPVITCIQNTLPVLKRHASMIKELGGVDEELAVSTKKVDAPRVPDVEPPVVTGPR